jgi:hypothetical protein
MDETAFVVVVDVQRAFQEWDRDGVSAPQPPTP